VGFHLLLINYIINCLNIRSLKRHTYTYGISVCVFYSARPLLPRLLRPLDSSLLVRMSRPVLFKKDHDSLVTTEQDGNFGPIVAVPPFLWRLREVALRGTWETAPKQLRKVDVNKKASVKV
jgi:hypothetical protein